MMKPGRRNFLKALGAGAGFAVATDMATASVEFAPSAEGSDQPDPQEILVAALREAKGLLMSNPNMKPEYRADGYLYLAGMLDFYVQRFLKGGDQDRPCFVRDMEDYRSWRLPTPNHHYYSAQIDGNGSYRILCQRGHVADYCFEILSGLAGDDGKIGDRIDALEASDLAVGADGRFEIHVGGLRRPHNWLNAGPNARVIFVRQTVNNWLAEHPTPMLIERLDLAAGDRRFSPPTMNTVHDFYRKAGRGLLNQVRFLNDFAINWRSVLPLNSLPVPSVGPAGAGYFPGQYNSKCRWQLGTDEGLLVTLREPNCTYQSLDLAHPVWFNSLHPRELSSSLTKAQSRASSDGLTRYVIASGDPGVMNWLDTGGLTEGFLFIRWQGVEGAPPQQPACRIARLADLRELFPRDEPSISADDRRLASRARSLAMDKRYF